jgi:riboflavin kinase/FMN adenylyltransferase
MYLTLKQEKEQLLRDYGVDFIYYFRFTKKLALLTPQEFVETVVETISPAHIVVGENFHFGNKRTGSAHTLEKLARGRFLVHIVARKKDDGTISSTRIRELLLLGNVRAANKLLGRPYTISGAVTKGKGKGTQLGFPTLNIRPSPHKLVPLDGVYKGDVLIHGKAYRSALFLAHDVVEAHVLRFSANVYREKVAVRLLERMRSVKRFKSDAALRRAIQHDVEMIRK